ncbi:gem-associated protein 8-like [Nymphalis io]|uniref:gem-associated protein 8-like n=1 Tax=Inachis io TaxID=171585 RepID=UPI002167AA6D|nr:gem-associated protein 8-like [Nymphalis io]
MFCPPPEEESQIVQIVAPKITSRKVKKKNKKRNNKKEAKKRHTKLANTMSAWAENYAVAATWQLKHQVAYWKARAKALEYENKVLHDVIRRNKFTVRSSANTESETRTETELDETDTESDANDENIEDDNNLEVSEEFIQFLTANAKFKEEAKRERERLKAKTEKENETEMLETPRETVEEARGRMKELYGDKWQRISALEMSLLSSFVHESDKSKPMYWPNIPFNFNNS